MDNIFYVYIYLDPRKPGSYNYNEYFFEFEPFYVGKGKKRRFYQHILNSRRSHINNLTSNIIKKIKEEIGKDPIIIKMYENLSEEAAFNKEIEVIDKIGKRIHNNGPLANITDGGGGKSGYKRISGNLISNETRIKLSISMKNAMKGSGNHRFGIKKEDNPLYGRGKKIYQYDIFGNLIKEWENSNILSRSLGIDRHSIDTRCKEALIKHYKNYFWSYKDAPDLSFIPLSKIERINKMYYVYSFSYEFIGAFKDIRSISKVINIPRDVLEYYKKYDFKI